MAQPELDRAPMTNDDLQLCRRRVTEYVEFRRDPGFDEGKLAAMISGCAHRQELLRADLKDAERGILGELIGRERPDLWA
jgi:hypothetical protein